MAKNATSSFFHNISMIQFSLKLLGKYDIRIIPTMLTLLIIDIIAPLINLFMAAKILDELLELKRTDILGSWVMLTIGLNLSMQLLRHILYHFKLYLKSGISHKLENEIAEKFIGTNYATIEAPQTRDKYVQFNNYDMWYGSIFEVADNFVTVMQTGLSFIIASGFILNLLTLNSIDSISDFNSLSSSPFILFLLILSILSSTIIGLWVNSRSTDLTLEYENSMKAKNRSFFYFVFELSNDYHFGKDIRLYNLAELLSHELSSFFAESHKQREQQSAKLIINDFHKITASTFSYGLAYLFVILKALAGVITPGSILMHVGIIANFSSGIDQFSASLAKLRLCCQTIEPLRSILELPQALNKQALELPKDALRQKHEIEFRNVSFHYPGSDVNVLKKINFSIHIGKRLAVVGLNGSGKTTLIKLLCRLYEPSEGEILINGVNILDYNIADYFALFGVVFQDFQLYAFSLGQNVASGPIYDPDLVWHCLKQAGLDERVRQMPRALETSLYTFLDVNGIELSGGEAQKLAIARALYKNAPIVVLDEPTASLDPISEYEIYTHLSSLASGKTAIFISHRLASCRFCDDILVIHEGQIHQHGSHEELLTETNGLYYDMWHAQAQYYVRKGGI